jgi:hypothetical protein
VLRTKAQERQWAVDWKTHGERLQVAETARGRGDLTTAFRDYCRAMRPLTDALRQHRNKEEVFQPVWDRRRG